MDFWWRRIRISDCYTGKRATTGLDDDIEGTGLDGRGRDEGEKGFWIDFGIVLNVYFIAIRTWVIDFSTKIVNEF